MRLPTRTGLVLALAVAAAAVVALPTAATGGTAAPSLATANEMTYQDSVGEDPNAPDITTVVVSNNDAGLLTFRVNVPNRPQLGQDMLFEIWVNTDNNATTGDPELAGVDYVIQLVRGEINLYRWDGSNFTRRFGDPSAITLNFAYQSGVTVRISAAELGNTKAFQFFAVAVSGIVVDPVTGDLDGSASVSDVAPGGGVGLYPYTVRITPPQLVVRRVTRTPARPTAGRPFTLRMTAARSDTGALLQNGRVTCVGRVGRARLRATTARVVGRAVTCTWRIPPKAKGKSFRGRITVVFEGLSATRSYTARIR